jgi:hypothetical protein
MLYVMLVGAYPFERPEDKTDTQKLQKMIQVTLEGHCSSPGCHTQQYACSSRSGRRQRLQQFVLLGLC